VSLAESKPERVKELFITKLANKAGCYALKLCINGTWQTVVIDDYLPCYPDSNMPCFARYEEGEDGKGYIWASLLEKAWAKMNGNYDRTVMGTLDMGFIHLCGTPSIGIKHSSCGLCKPTVGFD
jgi:calpain-15